MAEFKKFPIFALSGIDKLIWHYGSNDVYSVKSGYFLAMEDGVETSVGCSSGMSRYFRKLWHLNVQSKIKEVWENSAVWPILSSFKGKYYFDLWQWVILSGNADDLGCFAMIFWSIWLARNQLFHLGTKLQPIDVVSRASFLWTQFLSCQRVDAPKIMISTPLFWQTPPAGTIKINVDAAVVNGSSRVGLGVVVRDDQGVVLIAFTKTLEGYFSVHLAELLTVREGLLLASQQSWNHVIIETDASNVAKSITGSLCLVEDESIVSFIHQLSSRFSSFRVQLCRRNANGVAHILAADGLTLSVDFLYKNCLSFKD
ncbi:uncharacterized protein [Henckelia pumila]|uniref:uncharacterized protein n=1 Tax=Henckelia pumila TaxID=405737 RepID=UPI003C6E1C30